MDEAGADDASRVIRAGYAVDNLTRGLSLAVHVEVARSSAARRRGLLGVKELDAGCGLWIAPCEAVHTFGMKIALDAVFIDRDFQVRKISDEFTSAQDRRLSGRAFGIGTAGRDGRAERHPAWRSAALP